MNEPPVTSTPFASPAVGCALLGVSLLEESGAPASWGDFWSFASAVLFGVQIYRTEYWSKLLGGKAALPLMSMALIVIAGLALGSVVLAHPQTVWLLMQKPAALELIMDNKS